MQSFQTGQFKVILDLTKTTEITVGEGNKVTQVKYKGARAGRDRVPWKAHHSSAWSGGGKSIFRNREDKCEVTGVEIRQ